MGSDVQPTDSADAESPTTGATRTDILSVAALMVLAAILGVFHLATASVWLDESSSVDIAGRDLGALLVHITRVELNGSLYYLLLHPWMAVFGQSEAAIRSLSVVFVVVTVPVVWATAKALFDRRVAFAATLLIVTSAFIISYAQEARTYALALFLTSLATYLFVRGLRNPSWLTWLLYVTVAALSIYAHFYAVFLLAAHFISLAFVRRQEVPWRRVLISFGLIALLAVPAARFALFVDNAACRTAWIPPLDFDRIAVVFWEFMGANDGLLLAIGVAVLLSVAVFVLKGRDAETRWSFVFVLLLVVVPVGLSLVISAFRPLFAPRYLIVAFPGLAFLVAYGLARLRPRLLGVVALAGLVALSGWSVAAYYQEPRQADFRSVAEVVREVADENDAAIMYQRYGQPSHLLTYYLDQMVDPASQPVVLDRPDPSDFLSAADHGDCPTVPNQEFEAAIDKFTGDLQQNHQRVLLVMREASDDPFLPVLVSALESRYREVERVVWAGTRWYIRTELRVYEALSPSAGPAQ